MCLLNNFKFSKNFYFFLPDYTLGPDVYAVTAIVERDVKRDWNRTQIRATGASLPLTGEKMPVPGESTLEPHPPPSETKTCIKPHNHHKLQLYRSE